ncbi:Protein trichome birefringence [Rhynchospora pubera]|uniref:Protein trichome birefringence n=1 Tax=Rhynchospora pubera TaxID=906938 RepID=A0AAV8HF90_9POAL|nr:Protein trichome birefringence [Rhynchospora pubera]
MASPVSPCTPKIQNGTEWISLLQKKVASFLFLLLLLSAIFLFSTWYSSHSFTFGGKEALRDSPLLTEHLELNLTEQIIAHDEAISPSNYSFRESFSSEASFEISDRNAPFAIESCDLSKGKWLKDSREPLYSNLTCSFLPETRNCQMYGKPPGYLYWRWKPDECDMPRFESKSFLDLVRGKKMAFVGDSLARNQFDSLLCLLSQEETPLDVYHDPFDKFRTMHFPTSNFTLMVMWSEFYVQGIPIIINGTATASFDIHLDIINTKWTSQLPGLDYLIISGGNWFFRVNYLQENGSRIGCVNCREENLKDYGIAYAIRRVLRKALESIISCQNCDGLVTFLRTYTTSHFENGSWFNGGDCNRTEPLDEREINLEGIEWEVRKIQNEEIERIKMMDKDAKKHFGILDVTKAMMVRADGHPGAFYNKKWFNNANDCLHWCMPGPVDMWNEMLMLNLISSSSFD